MKRFLEAGNSALLKVCGITRMEDALAAVEAGANALGFNFYPPSPRFIDTGEAERIISGLPEGILTFAVIVHGSEGSGKRPGYSGIPESEILELSGYGIPESVDIIQVHGLEKAGKAPQCARPLLVAVSPETASGFDEYDIIIDTSWGRGRTADWEKIARITRSYVLSGGLTPENIEEALEKLSPAGIDVCSGVEFEPGKKDHVKLKDFLKKARSFYRCHQGRD